MKELEELSILFFVTFHEDTNTGAEDQKGGEKASRQGEGHVMYTCSFTHHHLSAYLPVPTGTHLAAKREEQNRSLLTHLTTFNPSSIVSFFLLDTVKGLTPVDVGSSKLSINS